jgi:hypothetical protein
MLATRVLEALIPASLGTGAASFGGCQNRERRGSGGLSSLVSLVALPVRVRIRRGSYLRFGFDLLTRRRRQRQERVFRGNRLRLSQAAGAESPYRMSKAGHASKAAADQQLEQNHPRNGVDVR